MKKVAALTSAILMSGAMLTPLYAADSNSVNSNSVNSNSVDMSKVSYVIGYEIGSGFQKQNIKLNGDVFNDALQTGLNGKESKYSKEDMEKTMQAFQKKMMEKAIEKQTKMSEKNKLASKKYIEKVANETGVKKLDTGVYYKVLKSTTDVKKQIPTATDKVTVNYEGSLLNGKVFDSSYARKSPVTFGVNQVIPCWQKALQKMPVGSTWMVYCAPEQAYGKYAPESIGPNQALKFKVELIKIDKTTKAVTKQKAKTPAA